MILHGLVLLAEIVKWLLVLVTLPLLIELLVLTLGAMWPTADAEADGSEPAPLNRLITIVPSHNEELSIVRCVESLAAASGSAQNVLVIAHNCSDATAALAERAGARVQVVDDPALRGKGHALQHGFNYAFRECGAEAVMIVDADSTVSPNITEVVLRRLAESPVLQCRYQVRNYEASWRTGLTALAFLGINVIRARGRDSLGLSCGIFGNGFAMRKDVLDHVAYDAHSIVEDMEFHLALVEHGYKVRFVREAFVLGDMPLSAGTSASQHSRWEGGRLRLLSDWGLRLAGSIVRGRVALMEPLIDLLGLPLALEVFCLMLLCLFPGHFARGYVAAAFAIVLLHLGAAIHASPSPKTSLRALLLAPIYLFWRLTMVTSAVRASSKGAAWVRTTRDSPGDITSSEILVAKAASGSQESS